MVLLFPPVNDVLAEMAVVGWKMLPALTNRPRTGLYGVFILHPAKTRSVNWPVSKYRIYPRTRGDLSNMVIHKLPLVTASPDSCLHDRLSLFLRIQSSLSVSLSLSLCLTPQWMLSDRTLTLPVSILDFTNKESKSQTWKKANILSLYKEPSPPPSSPAVVAL